MALKTKKPLFAAEPEPENTPEPEMTEEPYKVFKTKEEYEAAVAAAASKPEPEQPERSEDSREMRIALWQRDAQMLGMIVPDFDFEAALKNETFRNVLAQGGTVFDAYLAITKPAPSKRSEIFQNAQNNTRGTGDAGLNPAKLSSEEFKKYIDSIRNN